MEHWIIKLFPDRQYVHEVTYSYADSADRGKLRKDVRPADSSHCVGVGSVAVQHSQIYPYAYPT